MKRSSFLLISAAVATMVTSACNEPFQLRASRMNVVDTLTVYALTGSPPSYPSALSIAFQQLLRIDGSGVFDIVFDLDSAGRVIIYPVNMVVVPARGKRAVGMNLIPGAFADFKVASRKGYKLDSSVVISPGQVVAVEAFHGQDACQLYLSPYLYAKLVVDSVNVPARAIFIRAVMDPNCGFRGVDEGLPTE